MGAVPEFMAWMAGDEYGVVCFWCGEGQLVLFYRDGQELGWVHPDRLAGYEDSEEGRMLLALMLDRICSFKE